MIKKILALLVFCIVFSVRFAGGGQLAPVAKTIAWQDSIHGYVRSDDYHWLRNRTDPDVMQYLRDENAYTDSMMAGTLPLQKKLYQEFVSRIKRPWDGSRRPTSPCR